jgi:hypothetical protein
MKEKKQLNSSKHSNGRRAEAGTNGMDWDCEQMEES